MRESFMCRTLILLFLLSFNYCSIIAEEKVQASDYQKSLKLITQLYNSGKYSESEKKIKTLINQELSKDNLNNEHLTHLYFLLGRNLIYQRDKAALDPLEKCLHYSSKIKKDQDKFFNKYLNYDFYTFLSLAYNWNNYPNKSLKYAKLAYEHTLRAKKNNSPELIKSTFALAVAYRLCKDKKNAIKYGEKTLALFEQHPMFENNIPRIKKMLVKWKKE